MATNTTTFNNLGPRVSRAGGFELIGGPRIFHGNGFPKSGTAGTSVDQKGRGAPAGSIYIDEDTGVSFFNEGSVTSPYWTPTSFKQNRLIAWDTDFSDAMGLVEGTPNVLTLGKAVADTQASMTLTNGIKIHGQGIAETDSGLTVAFTATDGAGPVSTLTATDEDAHMAAISVGVGTTPVWQPDQNGTIVLDAVLTQLTANTLRNVFVGFHGDATVALDPIMTYATTVITNVGTDIAGLMWSAELTDATHWFNVNFDVAGGGTLSTATSTVATGVTVAAAGTYQRLRVEVDADGVVRTFINKALTGTSAAAAADVDEEFMPTVFVESTSAAVKSMLLRRFSTWGKRVVAA